MRPRTAPLTITVTGRPINTGVACWPRRPPRIQPLVVVEGMTCPPPPIVRLPGMTAASSLRRRCVVAASSPSLFFTTLVHFEMKFGREIHRGYFRYEYVLCAIATVLWYLYCKRCSILVVRMISCEPHPPMCFMTRTHSRYSSVLLYSTT